MIISGSHHVSKDVPDNCSGELIRECGGAGQGDILYTQVHFELYVRLSNLLSLHRYDSINA